MPQFGTGHRITAPGSRHPAERRISVVDERPAPSGLDVNTPNVARMWDYQLGGKDNFAVDRAAAEAVNKALSQAKAPDGHAVARENRNFIRRAVRFLAEEAGIRQFVDIGAGLPTQGNVHDVAHGAAPDARVVYVDYDPVVVVHGQALLTGTDKTAVVQADMREPEKLLAHCELQNLIDLDQPVAFLMVAVPHLLPDEQDPAGIVARLRDAMAPGSYLAITHTTRENWPDAAAVLGREFARLRVTTPMVPRDRAEILDLFDGFELVEPGLVYSSQWRPDSESEPDSGANWMFAGVGRKA